MDDRPDGSPRLWGKLKLRIKAGSLAFDAYQQARVEEAFNCNYELNPDYKGRLVKSGLRISGVSTDGGVRIIELPGHIFHMGTGFLPQYASEPGKPHPLIIAFFQAALSLKKLQLGTGGRPESLEGRWDILYRAYPEIYDEFTSAQQSGRKWIDVARKIVSFKGKIVADIGSGSGESTIQIAEHAGQVYGIEPEESMTGLAVKRVEDLGLKNILFKKGTSIDIPLEDNSVDITASAYGGFFFDAQSTRGFVKEAERITRPGGFIVLVGVAPKWYGGELAHLILGKTRTGSQDYMVEQTLSGLGFRHRDYYYTSDFGTVERAVRVYGFIFGKKTIDYLRAANKTSLKWKTRIAYKAVR